MDESGEQRKSTAVMRFNGSTMGGLPILTFDAWFVILTDQSGCRHFAKEWHLLASRGRFRADRYWRRIADLRDTRIQRIWLAAGLLLCLGRSVHADDWAKDMFTHTEHNFGAVARGAKAEHPFTFQNLFEEDIYILSVRSSCGCTTPTSTKTVVKKWEKADILATIDTRSFMGHKEAAITVKLGFAGSPVTNEVILKVSCYIRSDVVVQPGVIQFGSVAHGATEERSVTVSYAGRNDWAIKSIETTNPYFQGQAVETSRQAGQVTYQLTVKLADGTPAGYLKDQLVLVTNDLNSQTARVPVPVEGVVIAAITVSPSPLPLGVVEIGKSVTKQLVVQSKTPFKIQRIQCSDPRFSFEISNQSQKLHLVPVAFTAAGVPGNISERLRIETDVPNSKPLEVNAQVRVTAAAESSAVIPRSANPPVQPVTKPAGLVPVPAK